MSTNIEDRLILLLKEDGEPHGYWHSLEEKTGISAQRWRGAYARRQRPTTDMIQAICRQKPEYAFWMATGITDAANGHIAPSTAFTFPESPREQPVSHESNEYFLKAISLLEYLYYIAKVNVDDDNERLKASEKTRVGTDWWGGDLVNYAYEISESEAYKTLLQSHKYREEMRSESDIQQEERSEKQISPAIRNQPQNTKKLHSWPLGDPRTEHQGPRELFWKPKTPPPNDNKKS